ncbi:hypothetical protein [Cupriavidus basilensis]|uniref:hypothetical protein n=1 Tax=Cupriavidus basilensis TaxID=68895 RepID=UPI00157B1921|nr:hypothetical protein [Cupriavidus basilensis]NUA26315.1 hypothetical protein [Cupriavidus basilensis]
MNDRRSVDGSDTPEIYPETVSAEFFNTISQERSFAMVSCRAKLKPLSEQGRRAAAAYIVGRKLDQFSLNALLTCSPILQFGWFCFEKESSMSVHPGSVWIDQNFATQVPQDRWVAADATGLVAENVNYDDLIAYLRRQNVSLQDVTIAYFPAGAFQ